MPTINFNKVRQIIKKNYNKKVKMMFVCPDEETVRRLWIFIEYDMFPWFVKENISVHLDHNFRGMRRVHLAGKSYWEIETPDFLEHHLEHFTFTHVYLVEE